MKILNTEKEDYHVHSISFSDGFNTIDEIAVFAGKIGMKKIMITDHSQACVDALKLAKKGFREITRDWKNPHNKVDVRFGVEADLLNKDGDVCFHIQGYESEFSILSFHKDVYPPKDKSKVADAFIKAINKYPGKISLIGHVCQDIDESSANKVILEANKHKIPLELNARYFLKNPEKWRVLLDNADQVIINSDAHFLYDIQMKQKDARAQLRKMGYKA
ncbi:PHP domain-containing protein [Candidatus Woesearchaeota archaeon]|nr:PHP domain-containing protein [Candidatus Woesearchaeota archaeon]